MPDVEEKLQRAKPYIEKKEHELGPQKEEDVIVKTGRFRIYFQNYYTLISLINDIFTGVLYLTGSLIQTFTDFVTFGNYLFIFASFFLLMRPILKILHNVFLYDEKEYKEKVLGEDTEEAIRRSEGDSNKPTKEVDLRGKSEEKNEDNQSNQKEAGHRELTDKEVKKGKNSEEEIEKEYDESYYQDDKKE